MLRVLAIVVFVMSAHMLTAVTTTAQSLSNDECKDPSLPAEWSCTESWVWQQIAAGKVANLNKRTREADPNAQPLAPESADGWTEERRLRAAFIRTILTEPRFVEATPFAGVRILGALVDDDPIDLEFERLPYQFWLEKSRIETSVQARYIRVDGNFSLESSYVAGAVQLYGARISDDFSMAVGGTYAGPVNLSGARFTGGVFLRDEATFMKKLDLSGATIQGQLSMNLIIRDFRLEIC